MHRIFIPALLALLLTACGAPPLVVQERKSLLSELIDCSPSEIVTRNGRRQTWTATCQGVVYSCTGGDTEVCTELPKAAGH
jgi:hypothetical protein